jgi:hypothetical protein
MIFAFGTLYFWLLLMAAIAFVIFSIESEWGGTGATVTMSITFCLMYFLGAKDHIGSALSHIVNNPGTVVLMMLGYLLIGVIWSIRKWYVYVGKKKNKILNKIKDGDTIGTNIEFDLDLRYHKGRIISWMCYWPFSVVWFLINDPVRAIYNFIFEKIKRIYGRIAESAINDVKAATDAAKEKGKKK